MAHSYHDQRHCRGLTSSNIETSQPSTKCKYKGFVIILLDSEALVVWIKLFWFCELVSVNVNMRVRVKAKIETMSPYKVMPSIQFLST